MYPSQLQTEQALKMFYRHENFNFRINCAFMGKCFLMYLIVRFWLAIQMNKLSKALKLKFPRFFRNKYNGLAYSILLFFSVFVHQQRLLNIEINILET